MYAARKGWDVGEIEVDVNYEPAQRGSPTRFSMDVRMPKELPEDQRERLMQIAAKCPVHRTLEGEVMFDERVDAGLSAALSPAPLPHLDRPEARGSRAARRPAGPSFVACSVLTSHPRARPSASARRISPAARPRPARLGHRGHPPDAAVAVVVLAHHRATARRDARDVVPGSAAPVAEDPLEARRRSRRPGR